MADPNYVQNHDVVTIADKITRFAVEMYKSVSSSLSGVNVHDQGRLVTYLDAIDRVHDWAINVPDLDLPETHPRQWAIEAFPVIEDVESEEINQIGRLLNVCWYELVNSASARAPSGLNKHDSARLRSYVEKIRLFLVNYVSVIEPLDLPESMPKEKTSGSGLVGINPA